MKVIKDPGTFTILTPKAELRKQLLRIERAGRTCYRSQTGKISEDSARDFVAMLLKRGHESVIEHSSMTVKFMKVSRGFTHEIVRHRLASFSQESTRYVDYARSGDTTTLDLDSMEIHAVTPPHRDETEKIALDNGEQISLTEMLSTVESYYRGLRKAGWNPEDARQILPIGLEAHIVVTANFREWRHIFALRTSKPAHWEIRSVLGKLLKEVQHIVPGVFDDFKVAGKDANGVEYVEQSF
jgi:thymidylate synthase (FAD)